MPELTKAEGREGTWEGTGRANAMFSCVCHNVVLYWPQCFHSFAAVFPALSAEETQVANGKMGGEVTFRAWSATYRNTCE